MAAHIVDLAPLFFIRLGPGHASEAGEEPLCDGVDRIDGRLIGQLGLAGGDVESQEIFNGGQTESFNTHA